MKIKVTKEGKGWLIETSDLVFQTELRAEYKSLDSFIRAFVKYMKGE